MKGKYKVIVQNNRLHYELEIRRNITIIQGNSATGKTTLVNMLRQAENLGNSSGIDVQCDVPCRILEGTSWKLILENSQKTIFFIDEENAFMNTEEFASAVCKSDNYVVLITRENLYNLPCNGVQREHNKKLNNGLPILHKVPPKRDYGRYFCIMAEKGGTSHGGLTEKLSPFFHAKKQEVNAYGR